eukprot:1404190-Amphidinium_carterae.1
MRAQALHWGGWQQAQLRSSQAYLQLYGMTPKQRKHFKMATDPEVGVAGWHRESDPYSLILAQACDQQSFGYERVLLAHTRTERAIIQ